MTNYNHVNICIDSAKEARRRLVEVRNLLAITTRKILFLKQAKRVKSRAEQKLDAELCAERSKEASFLNQISLCEQVIYGDLVPVKPPNPERMQQIRKANQ